MVARAVDSVTSESLDAQRISPALEKLNDLRIVARARAIFAAVHLLQVRKTTYAIYRIAGLAGTGKKYCIDAWQHEQIRSSKRALNCPAAQCSRWVVYEGAVR
jgi:hypothetical protein